MDTSRDLPRGEMGRHGAIVYRTPVSRRRLRWWVAGTVLFMLVLLGMLYAFNAFRAHGIATFFANNKPPPAVVAMSVAETQSVPQYLPAIGTIQAVHQVTIASQIGGMVTQILFTPGTPVKAGDPLVQLDDGPEQGDLRNFEAQAHYAAISLKRSQALLARKDTPQATVDQNQSQLDQANAGIARTKALIAQKLIRAPFSGKLGVRQVELGQYVGAGTAMVTLTNLTQLYVNFTLPEQDAAMLRPQQQVDVEVDAYRDQRFPARIDTIEPQVSVDTRAIKVQAIMDNPDGKLLPGMFANVRVVLPTQPDVVTVPETAVENTLYGDSVYLVRAAGAGADGKPQLKAVRTPVKVGERFSGHVAILSGVAAGDRVVTSGQNKVLYDGAPVAESKSGGLTPPARIPNN